MREQRLCFSSFTAVFFSFFSLLKVCDDGLLKHLLCFWTLSIALFVFKTKRFGDWILSPS
jgi:hypothetical protein